MTDVNIDMPTQLYVGHECEFSVSIANVGSQAGTMVVGKGVFPSEGDYQVWYKEGDSWVEFTEKQDPDQYFGPASGFPLTEATSEFKVLFKEPITAEFTVQMLDAETKTNVIAEGTATVTVVEPETIESLNTRISSGGTVELTTDVWGTVNIANDVILDGKGFTLHGNIVLDAKSDSTEYEVSVKSLDMEHDDSITASSGYGIIGQNQTADSPVKPVSLSLSGCTISQYEKKGIYLTNAKKLLMTGCTIGDVATEEMNDPNTYGDYAIDLNLCAVTDAVVQITDNLFTGSCGAIGAVKVTQRGGIVDGVPLTDDVNTDIKNPASATIAQCIIRNNVFEDLEGSDVADVVLGSSPNSDGTARTYNTGYKAQVIADGETVLKIRGSSEGDMVFTIPDAGQVFSSGSVSATGKDNPLSIGTSLGVKMEGPVRDGATVDIPIDWTYVEGGPQGGAFLGFKRFVLHADSIDYPTGGIEIPARFRLKGIVCASAKGGVVPYLDTATRRVILYQNGAEASGTLEDVTLIVIGN